MYRGKFKCCLNLTQTCQRKGKIHPHTNYKSEKRVLYISVLVNRSNETGCLMAIPAAKIDIQLKSMPKMERVTLESRLPFHVAAF